MIIITIGGSDTIPEFPSTLVLAIVLMLVIAIFTRVKRRNH
jgi:hypothetical protein